MSVSSTPPSLYPGRPRGGLTIVPNRVIGLVSYTDPIRTRGFTRCPVCTLFRRNRLLRPSPRSLLLLAWCEHLPHHYNRTSTTKQQLACAIPWVAVLSEQSVGSSLFKSLYPGRPRGGLIIVPSRHFSNSADPFLLGRGLCNPTNTLLP
jgi:hypothetical protein